MMDMLKRLFCLIGLRHGAYVCTCVYVCIYVIGKSKREETEHGAGASRVRVRVISRGDRGETSLVGA